MYHCQHCICFWSCSKLLSDIIFVNFLSPCWVVCLPPISLWFCTVNLMQTITQHCNFQTSSCIILWSRGIWKQTWKTTAIFFTYRRLPPMYPMEHYNCLVFLQSMFQVPEEWIVKIWWISETPTFSPFVDLTWNDPVWHFQTTRQQHILSEIQYANISWPDGPVICKTGWPSYNFTGQHLNRPLLLLMTSFQTSSIMAEKITTVQ